ncbi:hypothetical protein J6590_096160, partial [Homalodisca vitripennis]
EETRPHGILKALIRRIRKCQYTIWSISGGDEASWNTEGTHKTYQKMAMHNVIYISRRRGLVEILKALIRRIRKCQYTMWSISGGDEASWNTEGTHKT